MLLDPGTEVRLLLISFLDIICIRLSIVAILAVASLFNFLSLFSVFICFAFANSSSSSIFLFLDIYFSSSL